VAALASSNDGTSSLVMQAASAAAEAATEAAAATAAASSIDSIGSLCVTTSTASTAATAARQVVSAVEALEEASSALSVSASETAAEVMADVKIAGRALTTAWARAGDGMDSGSGMHALDAAQVAAKVLREAADTTELAATPHHVDIVSDPMAKGHDLMAKREHALLQSVERAAHALPAPLDGIPDPMTKGHDLIAAREYEMMRGSIERLALADPLQHNIDLLIREGVSCVLWCWIPRSSRWTANELLERSTRAVAACRADDIIALPELPLVRELVAHWASIDYGGDQIKEENVIWFDAQPAPILVQSNACGPPDQFYDPMFSTVLSVLQTYHLLYSQEGRSAGLYCMYPDERICRIAASFGLRCLGDLDQHPIVGSLRQAKSFLHPSLGKPCRPSLRDAAMGELVRGPRGFCCASAEQLQEAWTRLKQTDPAIKLVLKPASGSGGTGVVLDATQSDVEVVIKQMHRARKGRFTVKALDEETEETILEEMVGQPGQPSPTVYMVADRVAVVADQLLTPCGTINLGNISPATQVPSATVRAMGHACEQLGRYLGLRGQWGVDFVLNDDGLPIMVDLNMGRPNGSLSYYCWRARQQPPRGVDQGAKLALACTTYCPPAGLRLTALTASLAAKSLLWESKRGEGIILAQHLPGAAGGGTVLAASWQGTNAARVLLDAFKAHVETLEGVWRATVENK